MEPGPVLLLGDDALESESLAQAGEVLAVLDVAEVCYEHKAIRGQGPVLVLLLSSLETAERALEIRVDTELGLSPSSYDPSQACAPPQRIDHSFTGVDPRD